LLILLGLALASPARAQVPEARRLGMGGVLLSEVTQSSTQNVAFRAVPTGSKGLAGYSSIPCPLESCRYAVVTAKQDIVH